MSWMTAGSDNHGTVPLNSHVNDEFDKIQREIEQIWDCVIKRIGIHYYNDFGVTIIDFSFFNDVGIDTRILAFLTKYTLDWGPRSVMEDMVRKIFSNTEVDLRNRMEETHRRILKISHDTDCLLRHFNIEE